MICLVVCCPLCGFRNLEGKADPRLVKPRGSQTMAAEEVHRERTIRQIKEQSKTVGDQMAATERYHQVQRAVAKAQAEHPEAKVSVHHVQSHSIDAVLVEHPPDPNDAAQVALGFGALEIKASYETE